ncbi:MAG TPA: GNAT family N-acetyltransferase [Nocardioidaceae bacterium]|nr:GNAT family N-acetyltransferase [Nocardioidaceae bacterium]
MIELSHVGPDDWRVWRTLRLAALAEAPYAFGSTLADWQGAGDLETRWRSRLGICGSHNVVATLCGEPVGMASGVPSDDAGAVELISMWVSPAGRGQGVGDALLREVERWARTTGAGRLQLAVTDGNDPAAAMYLRNGFVFTGALGDVMPDGMRRERVMAKALVEAG